MKIFAKKSIAKVIVVSLLLIIIFELAVSVFTAFNNQIEERELYRKSYSIQAEIEKVFLNVYSINDAYTSFISENPNVTKEETEAFLQHLFSHEERYVKNIAFIEDTTIKFNYPYEENKSSIGIDLIQVDGQRDDIIFVKQDLTRLFIGPVELVQGGTAFIIREPLDDNGVYFGQIATVMDASELISLLEKESETYNIEIEIRNSLGEKIISIGDDFSSYQVTTDVDSEYIEWSLSVYDLNGPNDELWVRMGIRIIGVFTTMIVAYYVYKNAVLLDQVTYRATHDLLTNTYNRTVFTESFLEGKFFNRLIAFLDINKFKVLNDTLGHHFGDWALQELTKEFVNTNMFDVFRNSGDEFILVSKEPMTEREYLSIIKNNGYDLYNEELKQTIFITFSVGVIERVSEDLTLANMLIYLDYAMYDAKKQRQLYTIVDNELMSRYNEQKRMEQVLIEDIMQNEFVLFYQPIIDVSQKKIYSVEVLSRWKYQGALVPAARFVDIVKKIKYIDKVDKNLFDNLQKEYLQFLERCPNKDITFSINLSAELLLDFEKDYTQFDRYIHNIKIPVKNIIFEVSEDVNLGIISDDTLDYIKSKGFSLVIDDFGSGVSKLSDVLSGKLLAIKTDKEMLPKGKDDDTRLNAFNTIIKAINSTGSQVCVEGVETKEQLDISVDAGCNIIQGYLFGKPMSFNDIAEYINTFDFDEMTKK